MRNDRQRHDPCDSKNYGATTWCLYYDAKQPNKRDSDGKYGVECPKTCYYARQRLKNEDEGGLEKKAE